MRNWLNGLDDETVVLLALIGLLALVVVCGIGGLVLSDIFGSGAVD